MGSREVVIEARGLNKTYGNVTVLEDIDFKIYKGECFGFLGPIGAGKSTIIRLLSCCAQLTSGELFIHGLNAREHQRNIKRYLGAVSDHFPLDPEFSIFDNLYVFGRLHGKPSESVVERARQLLRQFHLEDIADLGIDVLKPFQRKQLELARALIVDPEIIFFDQPTSLLDSEDSHRFFELIRAAKNQGKTIVMTTSSIQEVDTICDKVALLDKGKLLYEGPPRQLVEDVVGREVVEFYCPTNELDYYLSRLKERYEYQVSGNRVRIYMTVGQESKAVLQYIASENLTIRRSHLGDVFLKIAGRDL